MKGDIERKLEDKRGRTATVAAAAAGHTESQRHLAYSLTSGQFYVAYCPQTKQKINENKVLKTSINAKTRIREVRPVDRPTQAWELSQLWGQDILPEDMCTKN